MNSIEKVIRISLALTKDGFNWTNVEYVCKEKGNMCELSRKDDYGNVINRILKKDSINQISPYASQFPNCVHFNIFSTVEFMPDARIALMEKIVMTVNGFKIDIDRLFHYLQ